MSSLEIIECDQRSDAWHRARLGIPTASEFKCLLVTKGKGEGGESKTRRKYANQLAAEIVRELPTVGYTNSYMERGVEQEDEARTKYEFMRDIETVRVGFIRNGRKGCSPDSLIGDDGMLEIKTAEPWIHVDYVRAGVFPAEHKAQCQGALWVAERHWIDVAIYCPGLPLFVKRAFRDEEYIAELTRQVDLFNAEVDAIVETIRRYGRPGVVREMFERSVEAAG